MRRGKKQRSPVFLGTIVTKDEARRNHGEYRQAAELLRKP
jgi:hypothetical protein